MRSEKSVLEDRAKALVVGWLVWSQDWKSVVVNTFVMACDTQAEGLLIDSLIFLNFSTNSLGLLSFLVSQRVVTHELVFISIPPPKPSINSTRTKPHLIEHPTKPIRGVNC